MAEFSLPTDLNLQWASSGDVLKPTDTKIQQGWQPEIPARQHFNWLDNRQDQAIAHIAQHGISVWSSTLEYQAGKSYVQGSNGKVYVAIQTHTNQNPTTDLTETYWADVLKNNMVVITSTTSWTVPPILKLGVKKAFVRVIGAGGGGGRNTGSPSPSGGGGGGVAESLLDLTGVTSIAVTVGVGGTGASLNGQDGTAGGSSSFGAYLSATGGQGGVWTGAQAGFGGVGVGGQINYSIGAGSVPFSSVAAGFGGGGESPAGGTGATAPVGKGQGGAGRINTAAPNGASGQVVICW